MNALGDANLHFWRTRSVGRCIGLNFGAALDDGRLSPREHDTMLLACLACPNVQPCQHWLGGQRGTAASLCPPAFCPNADRLEALKPR